MKWPASMISRLLFGSVSSGVYSQVVSPLITLAFVIASTRIMLGATETRRSW